jgi:hypothetical protein
VSPGTVELKRWLLGDTELSAILKGTRAPSLLEVAPLPQEAIKLSGRWALCIASTLPQPMHHDEEAPLRNLAKPGLLSERRTGIDPATPSLGRTFNPWGEVGHYHAKVQKDGSIVVRCETPYPAAFEHGLVEGISANPRLLQPGERYAVHAENAPPGGRLTCTLTVKAI